MKFELDENKIILALDKALQVWAVKMLEIAKENVPRDQKRLPKPIILKRKPRPERNIRKWNRHFYRKPVIIWGNWYEGVTGNLRRSLTIEKIKLLKYKVWVASWPVEKYAYTQEYWDPKRNIPKRSFLKKPFEENFYEIMRQVNLSFKEILWHK